MYVSFAVGVSFVAIFIVSYHLVFWVGGAARSLAWDYLPGVPQGAEAERRCAWYEKPIGGFVARHVLRMKVAQRQADSASPEKVENAAVSEREKEKEKEREKLDDLEANLSTGLQVELQPELGVVEENCTYETDPDIQLARRTSHISVASQKSRRPSVRAGASSLPQPPATPPPSLHSSGHASVHEHPSSYFARLKKTLRPLSAAVTPITTSLAISLPIALITDLKALFVDTTDQGGPSWHGPDGNPPLNFIYVSGKSPPISCFFARLRIREPTRAASQPSSLETLPYRCHSSCWARPSRAWRSRGPSHGSPSWPCSLRPSPKWRCYPSSASSWCREWSRGV